MSDDKMKLGQSIEQRLEQRLTPQLIMNMKLLELPLMELEQLIRNELEQNPALEQFEGDGDDEVEEYGPDGEQLNEAGNVEEGLIEQPSEGDSVSKTDNLEQGTKSDNEEYTFDELLPSEGWDAPVVLPAQNDDEEMVRGEVIADPRTTLRETILPHLQALLPTEDAALAEEVVEWLDENGFLSVTVEELGEKLAVDEVRLRRIVYQLQRIPPGGIGCRNAREALLVQLEVKGCAPDALECRLIAEGWELLERRDTNRLAKKFGCSEDEIKQAIARLWGLEPKPARRFVNNAVQYVSPDFSVVWQGNRLVAVMNDEAVPRLRISRYFIEVLRNPRQYTREQVEYAKKRVEAARQLLKALESRRRMLRRLVELIIQMQRDFFVLGPEHLKPATLRAAAEVIGVHPATVSRAINGKYIETPNGIFPLKFFFQAGTEDISRASIKEKIKAMIESEDKRSPLSDDEIVSRLKAAGIEISRRTVAKYRNEMGIPGSSERKGF